MKRISILLGLITAVMVFQNCGDSKLPYDLESLGRGALIDVSKTSESDPFVVDSPLPGYVFNLGVKLQIVEKGDGPWESVDLILVYNNTTSYVYRSNITELPTVVQVDFNEVLEMLGLENAIGGDVFSFTVDVHQADGTVIYGWTPYTGYNNSPFAGWVVENRPYSIRAQWLTQGAFYANVDWLEEYWSGPATSFYYRPTWTEELLADIQILAATDVPTAAEWSQLGIAPEEYETFNLAGFDIVGFYMDNDDLSDETPSHIRVWVNESDLRVFIPDQYHGIKWNIGSALGGADDFQELWSEAVGDAEIITSNGFITWKADMNIGNSGYWFNRVTFEITSHKFIDEDGGEKVGISVKNLKMSNLISKVQ